MANADNIKGAIGEKVRKGKELAVLSKKLATIITSVPVEFHEEDFKLKEWNKDELKNIFSELEFRTLGKRLLGEDFTPPPSPRSVVEKEIPQGVQTDLFGNIISSAPTPEPSSVAAETEDEEEVARVADKNIHNT
ncbi:MAG: DNA polymerase I, partial [Chitinophagia bacterium]|nr:DNA polymerase I [Chitinophagia bacterium]